MCACTCGLQVTGVLGFGEGAHNLDVGEEGHPFGAFKLGSGSPDAVRAMEGDLGLDGLQHHHVGVHVGEADTHIFSKAPGKTAVTATEEQTLESSGHGQSYIQPPLVLDETS